MSVKLYYTFDKDEDVVTNRIFYRQGPNIDYATPASILETEKVKIECLCGNIEKDSFQIDDYVSNPMIWCDECCGRYFICVDCKPKVIKEGDMYIFECNLLTIEKVMNSEIYSWKWTDKLYKKYFDQFIETGRNCDEFAKKIGLQESKQTYPIDNEKWNYAVNCNDYNAENVDKPINMRHDGPSILCMCICEKCGTESFQEYNGD